MQRAVIKFAVLAISCGLVSYQAVAHNVVSGAYAEGMLIEGEIGYSNGEMAEPGSKVQVYDGNHKLLDEVTLQEGGVFVYKAEKIAKHVFRADLSAGHVAEILVEAEELTAPVSTLNGGIVKTRQTTDASVAGAEVPVSSTTEQLGNTVEPQTQSAMVSIEADQLQRLIRAAVAQQIKPLQRELRAYKEKVMLRDIAGGLGFIIGLFGIAAYMASRRKTGGNDATVS